MFLLCLSNRTKVATFPGETKVYYVTFNKETELCLTNGNTTVHMHILSIYSLHEIQLCWEIVLLMLVVILLANLDTLNHSCVFYFRNDIILRRGPHQSVPNCLGP